ncbi:general substrate transporter, partial [Desarmillaria ectypa]
SIGAILQTAAQNYSMFLVRRIVVSAAAGGFVGTVAIIQHRNLFIGGLTGFMSAFGGSWFACGYVPATNTFQWQFHPSLQIPPSIILFLHLQFFLPKSPRQLISLGCDGEARTGGDLSGVALLKEFNDMREQILFEKSDFSTSRRRRGHSQRPGRMFVVHIMSALTGINIVSKFSGGFFLVSLGITGDTALVLAGVFGTVGFIMNLPSIYLLDRFGYVKLLKWGMTVLYIDLVYCALMIHYFCGSDNNVGKGMTYLGLNSAIWLYSAEVLPIYLRNKILVLASVFQYSRSVAVTEAGPCAFTNIGANFYYVFVTTTFLSAVAIFIYFPEIKGKTLEEIAASFGDKVVYSDDAMDIRDLCHTRVKIFKKRSSV